MNEWSQKIHRPPSEFTYLTEAQHSRPPSFWDRSPKLTLKFGLVLVPLVVELAHRRTIRLLAGPTGWHLGDKPASRLPTRAVGTRRLR